MRKSNVNESQIVGILKEAESGVPVADLLRQHGISKTTFQSTPRRPSFSNPRQTVRRLATNRLVFSGLISGTVPPPPPVANGPFTAGSGPLESQPERSGRGRARGPNTPFLTV